MRLSLIGMSGTGKSYWARRLENIGIGTLAGTVLGGGGGYLVDTIQKARGKGSIFQKIDEFEKEPAYKRKGLDLDENLSESPSRLSIENDSNNDLQIRSNNSFLHDNVD